MDIGNMACGDFLSARDMKAGDKFSVRILDEGRVQPADEESGYRASLLLSVEYKGKKTLRLGMRNISAVAAKFGTDTKQWIGQEITLLVYQTNFQSKLGFQVV